MEGHLARLTFVVASTLAMLTLVHAQADAEAYKFIGCHTEETFFEDREYFGNKSAGSYASAVDAAAGAPMFAVAKGAGAGALYGHGWAFQTLYDDGLLLDNSLPGCKQECSDSTKYCGTSRDSPEPGQYARVWAVYEKVEKTAPPSPRLALPSPSPSPSVKQAPPASPVPRASPVPSPTPQAAPTQDAKHSGLSAAEKVKLAVGLGVGIPCLFAAVAGVYMTYRYRAKKEAAMHHSSGMQDAKVCEAYP
jgi:hypothetical protein